MLVEVLDQGVNDCVRDQRLARAVRSRLIPIDGEHTAKLIVGVGNSSHGRRERFAKVCRFGEHVSPAGSLRDLKAVLTAGAKDSLLLLGELLSLLAILFSDGVVCLVLPLVA